MDRRAHLAKPIPGTCDWILSYPGFRTWISSTRSDVLHLTGDMGSGKSTIMSFLNNHLKSNRFDDAMGIDLRSFTVCSFFCSGQHHHFRDAVWILRGILSQLLDQNENLLQSMHTSIAALDDIPAENWNQSLLWSLLENALHNVLSGPVVLIIDALDECEESSVSLLLENIGNILNHESQNPNNYTKVLISSRPTISFQPTIRPVIATLSVDTEEVFESLQKDVKRLINYEIGRLATAGRWTQEMSTVLGEELGGKSGVSFLWVRLVLNRMELGSQDMLRLRMVIDESPKDLDQFYCHILASIDDDNRDLAAKMLRVLVGSMRPLTTNEFRMALAILSSGNKSLQLEEIKKARDRNIKYSIRNVLKSLACIRGNKVQLYHLSTKEFLLRLSEGKVNNLELFRRPCIQTLYGVTHHAANIDLARASITFLGLDDFNEDTDKTQDESLSMFAELPLYSDDDEQLSSCPPMIAPESPSTSSSISEDGPAQARMLSVREKIKKHMFYAYSANYWALHLRLVGPLATKELLESSIHISDPNENCLMHWSDLYRSSQSGDWVALPTPLDPLIISAFFGVVSLGNEVLKHLTSLEGGKRSLALCWACRMGHIDFVEMLLAHKVDLAEHWVDGRWPISWACANGHLKIVEMLLKEDCELQINLPDSWNRSPLSLAVESGNLAITKLLLAVEGIDLNTPCADGGTPIFWSIKSEMGLDDIRLLKKLLTINEIDILRRDRRGRTILSWAAERGALKTIDMLLKSPRPEIDILLEDTGGTDTYYGRSPLGYAAFYGHADVVEVLCRTRKASAQLASIDNWGENAVSLAATRGNLEVVQVFAKYYPQGLDVQEENGRTPLSVAMWGDDNENSAKLIRMLIKGGVDVNKRSFDGRTPLSYAARGGKVKMIRILVEEGNADMDIADNDGMLPEDYGPDFEKEKKQVKDEFRRLRASKPSRKA